MRRDARLKSVSERPCFALIGDFIKDPDGPTPEMFFQKFPLLLHNTPLLPSIASSCSSSSFASVSTLSSRWSPPPKLPNQLNQLPHHQNANSSPKTPLTFSRYHNPSSKPNPNHNLTKSKLRNPNSQPSNRRNATKQQERKRKVHYRVGGREKEQR